MTIFDFSTLRIKSCFPLFLSISPPFSHIVSTRHTTFYRNLYITTCNFFHHDYLSSNSFRSIPINVANSFVKLSSAVSTILRPISALATVASPIAPLFVISS